MDPTKKHADKLAEVVSYFNSKLEKHGVNAKGLDYNSAEAQEIRFEQLCKVINLAEPFSVNDYGCGYGSLADYLKKFEYTFSYTGFDISQAMIDAAKTRPGADPDWKFTTKLAELSPADYTIACGVFNLRINTPEEQWLAYVLESIENIAQLSSKGFSFNMLTKYSDKDKMRDDLFYGDPALFFNHCKRNYSRNVALLHDYELYDFTIVVRL